MTEEENNILPGIDMLSRHLIEAADQQYMFYAPTIRSREDTSSRPEQLWRWAVEFIPGAPKKIWNYMVEGRFSMSCPTPFHTMLKLPLIIGEGLLRFLKAALLALVQGVISKRIILLRKQDYVDRLLGITRTAA